MKPYKYKFRHTARAGPAKKAEPFHDGEALTGVVQGQPASDLEERFAIALGNNPFVTSFEFQPSYVANRNLSGEIRLDFLVNSGGVSFPVQIDGEFAHGSSAQKEEDKVKDGLLDDLLRPGGVMPTKRITGLRMHTQHETDVVVRELFG